MAPTIFSIWDEHKGKVFHQTYWFFFINTLWESRLTAPLYLTLSFLGLLPSGSLARRTKVVPMDRKSQPEYRLWNWWPVGSPIEELGLVSISSDYEPEVYRVSWNRSLGIWRRVLHPYGNRGSQSLVSSRLRGKTSGVYKRDKGNGGTNSSGYTLEERTSLWRTY